MLSIEDGSSNRVTFNTMLPHVLLGVLEPPPICFSSERFSRCGETFSYLKIDGSKFADDYEKDRGEMENEIDEALRKASIGCVTGGGWGPKYNYIDLALPDIEKAIPILRKAALELQLPKETWLLFLDSHLSHEWVGMHSDSPPTETTLDCW